MNPGVSLTLPRRRDIVISAMPPKSLLPRRKLNILARIQLFIEIHWIKLAIAVVILAAATWPILALRGLDSYQRSYILAFMSMTPLQSILYSGIFVAMLYWLHYGGGSFGKLKKSKVKGEHVDVHWDDVIGLEEAKQEAWEVVELLRDHAKVQQIGGKVLRGVLLSGPPGCGKTYLAKAIATEADLPFLSVSGSEFIEIFVGTGPARVRRIFNKAQQLARTEGGCLIFIDELDAVGTSRGQDLGFGAQTERNNTVNELLVQMDGLESLRYNIVVLAATNASEATLDQALLRPGRLDRKIYVDIPGLEDREKVLRFYLSKVKTDASVDVARLARRAVWKSPADIESIVKEAALIAARSKRTAVTYKDLSDGLDRIELGFKRRRKMTEDERRRIAYHEAGHAIVTYLLHPTDDVFKASIISRRNALGVVLHQPREELFTSSRDRILGNIKVYLAGYVAEKLKFDSTSDGVAADFHNAMRFAHMMVWRLGMGSNGYVGDFEALLSTSQFRGAGTGDRISDAMKDRLNEETHAILRQCTQEVEALLKKEDALLDRFANELLEREELEYDDIEAIFVDQGKQRPQQVPNPNPPLPPPAAS